MHAPEGYTDKDLAAFAQVPLLDFPPVGTARESSFTDGQQVSSASLTPHLIGSYPAEWPSNSQRPDSALPSASTGASLGVTDPAPAATSLARTDSFSDIPLRQPSPKAAEVTYPAAASPSAAHVIVHAGRKRRAPPTETGSELEGPLSAPAAIGDDQRLSVAAHARHASPVRPNYRAVRPFTGPASATRSAAKRARNNDTDKHTPT